MGPYLFLTAVIWHPSVVTWSSRQYRLRWGGISEIYNHHSTSFKPSSVISTVPVETSDLTHDVTVANSSDEKELTNGIGLTSKIKV